MIGWKADYGYYSVDETITINPVFQLENLSSIVFTDVNRYFVFTMAMPDAKKPPQPFVRGSIDEIYGEIYNYLSAQEAVITYTWPNVISNTDPQRYDTMVNAFPAITSMCPNLYNLTKNSNPKPFPGKNTFGVCYLKTLGKIIAGGVGSGFPQETTAVGDVLDDGTIVWYRTQFLYQGLNCFPIRGYYCWPFGLHNYTNEDDVKYASNFFLLWENTSSSGFEVRYAIPQNSSNVSQVLQFIFSKTAKPDVTIIPPDNPYQPGGPSGEGGGGGSFDKDSDLIPDSSLPSISAANTGFTRIYNPTLAQVQDLARYLWTDESVIETIWNHIKQYFESPMEAILGFNLVPVPVPNGGVEDFALMYIKTGVMMNTAANQFVDRDCGTFEIKPYYGSALDYSPYTKVSCFLPYIGTVQLNTDEVMGTTLQVKYRVDICSGSCVAKIFVNGSCLYQYSGHCAINIPISASDFSSYVSSAISVAKLAIGAATGAGMAAAASVLSDPVQQTNQVVTRTTTTTETARNPLSGRQITTGTRSIVETTERPANVSSTQASFDGLTPSNISNTVGQIMGSKPHVEHSGSFSGNTGYLGVRRPFLIIERPNMCMPEQYQQFNGFPAMITLPLSECTGFTQVQQVQLTGMEATNPEQSEILQMLKTGVIL